MNRFAKFMKLSGRRRRLLLRTWLQLNATAIGLRLFSLPRILQSFGTNTAARNHTPGPFSKEEIIWTVRAAAALAWSPTCAVRALVAERLLRRNGHAAQFKVGVRPGEDFQAHAWVEDAGGVLVGESEIPYHSLPDLSARDLVSPF